MLDLDTTHPYYLGGEPQVPNRGMAVLDKYRGMPVTYVARADANAVRQAICRAAAAAQEMQALKVYQRQAILRQVARLIEKRRDELAELICVEAGKPVVVSRAEVQRAIDTFDMSAEACGQVGGEVLPLDLTERAAQHMGMTRRVPVGPCALITPFNFPLNLVAHKVAPAIAAGCPFVLKPSPQTPLSAIALGQMLKQTDLPPGSWSIVTCSNEDAAPLIEDDRIRLLSFTGSDTVGWALKAKSGKKKVLLELGGNAAVIVDRDWDVADALDRIVFGTFYQSGQSCISVQRILVHDDLYDHFRHRLIESARRLKTGDPRDEQTTIGPMISEHAAERLVAQVQAAVEQGGRLLCGGKRQGAMVEPTVLEDVPEGCEVVREEAFGPVAVLSRFHVFKHALDQVNRSRFGLQAGVFTRDLGHAYQAWDELEVGTVLIGDVPSWRVDHMPYGGVKDSGLGREGPRYAIEAMTELRLMVVR
ncbi:MAG: aldehyde dehydrogenase family protein, partial [Phycisphaeraceae bacterium]